MAFQIDLRDKVVMISGVSQGIGAGISRMFADAGASVSGCSRSSSGEKFLEEMKSRNVKSLYTRCDVRIEADLQKFLANTIEAFGRIDVLVSNAGANTFSPASECTSELWNGGIDLNLASHWKLAKFCKPYLDLSNGVIIIITSNHAYSTIKGCFPYNVAKTSLTGLVRALAIEWGPSIRTVGLAPGFIDTKGNQSWFDSFSDPAAERIRTINLHPLKRIGTADEVGGWCVFLASTYANFATGTTYLVDGGRSALMQDE